MDGQKLEVTDRIAKRYTFSVVSAVGSNVEARAVPSATGPSSVREMPWPPTACCWVSGADVLCCPSY